jgi:hypothetical protein
MKLRCFILLVAVVLHLSGCTIVTYQGNPPKVTVIDVLRDRRADSGYVRLSPDDSAVLQLAGYQSHPDANAIQIVAGAILRGLMLIP